MHVPNTASRQAAVSIWWYGRLFCAKVGVEANDTIRAAAIVDTFSRVITDLSMLGHHFFHGLAIVIRCSDARWVFS
jgi:hypothetical protein